jgi:HSP20 family molecular chaperone IbpA
MAAATARQRQLTSPEIEFGVVDDQMIAKYEQGVLQLTLPKLVEDKIVKVKITH